MPTTPPWVGSLELGTPRRVIIESSPALLASIQAKQAQHDERLQAKGHPPASQKSLTVVAQFSPSFTVQLKPIDLLHRLGVITTPVVPNLADISSWWAYIRYLWAFEPPDGTLNDPLRLSDAALGIDFHQKGLMSEELGVGMAALIMELYFNAPEAADVSLVVSDQSLPAALFKAASPDYLFSNADGTTYYVVECKGTRCSRAAAVQQLRRGTEQVPSFCFTDGRAQPTALVIGTRLTRKGTEVLVVDPPADEEGPNRTVWNGPKRLEIRESRKFQQAVKMVSELKILAYAGADQTVQDMVKRRWPEVAGGVANDNLGELSYGRMRSVNFRVFSRR